MFVWFIGIGLKHIDVFFLTSDQTGLVCVKLVFGYLYVDSELIKVHFSLLSLGDFSRIMSNPIRYIENTPNKISSMSKLLEK